MNLLMITRKVDRLDSHAGHTHRWVQALAREVARTHGKMLVLCLQQGDVSGLPDNVTVHSLGKERGVSRLRRWVRFPAAAWPLVARSHAVFCHQNPEYALAVWPIARLLGRRVVAWYVHGTVTWKTRLMAHLVDAVLTASPESFRVRSRKVQVTGHGIDLEMFTPQPRQPDGQFRIVSVGRISPTKDYETLIQAVAVLRQAGLAGVSCEIVGGPGLPQHQEYFESLRTMIERLGLKDAVRLSGPVANERVAAHYQHADVMVNLSGTGSVDKAGLEAMACGLPLVTSNAAFRTLVPSDLLVPPNNSQLLADALRRVQGWDVPQRRALGERLRAAVARDHSLPALAAKIVAACRGGGAFTI